MSFKGFFPQHELEEAHRMSFKSGSTKPRCFDCSMYRGVKSPRMKCHGQGLSNVLLIAEAPGAEEDRQNDQLVGTAGRFFQNKLKQNGYLLDRDFFRFNAVNCRPVDKAKDKNRQPSRHELQCCKPYVEETINKLRPLFIWLMGGKAVESMYMEHFKNVAINRWRGLCIPDREYNAYIVPIYHPSYVSRESKKKEVQALYDRDLKQALRWIVERPPFDFINDNIRVFKVYRYEKVIDLLDMVIEERPPYFYFDFETTGKKPHRDGHKIVTVSFCTDGNIAHSFPFQHTKFFDKHQQLQIKKRLRQILTDKLILKQAHNLKFEHVWAKTILGIDVYPWEYDSMLAAHVLDNRSYFTKLKFQTYIRLGVLPYDKSIKKFLEAKGSNEFNRVMDAPVDSLLHYNALDSLYGRQVRDHQLREFDAKGGNLYEAYEFFLKGAIEFAHIQRTGICMNSGYYLHKDRKIGEEIKQLETDIKEGKEAQKFKKQIGRTLNFKKDISINDLRQILFDVLGEKIRATTESGLPSVDEDVLSKIDIPFTRNILKRRKLLKIKGTYLGQFLRETYNDKMYPNFDLNIPVSYRSSSSEPNFQNVPVREEEAKKATRRGIIPSPGFRIGELDFSGIEVCVSACYHKDPKMIEYITDDSTDMHRDAAADIWKLPKKDITKEIRFYAKNCWVFPQFYGSYFEKCAPNLIDACADLKTGAGVVLTDHLSSKGIIDYDKFEAHCKTVEKKFWNNRFKVYKQWKEDIIKEYLKNGYIESYLGFRFTGLMGRNECTNYQIQGTAFHCLLWTLIRVAEVARKEKWRTKLIGQIHDSMLFDFDPNEVDHVLQTVNRIGTIDIRNEFDWIIVPLKIDAEIAGIDESWYDTVPVKL